MRIAVTGGSGKIGTVVCQRLIEIGHAVTILDKRPPKVAAAKFQYTDLRDRQFLHLAMQGCDAVVHLGEIADQNGGDSSHDLFTRNLAAASTVLQTAAELRIERLIYTSTCQVYGLWGRPDAGAASPIRHFPIDESQPLNPQNTYALAKVAAEGYARLMSVQHQLSVTIFRLPAVIQPDPSRWLNWIENTPDQQLHASDGLWSFVHAEDVADAYVASITRPQSGIEIYHLAAPDVLGTIPLQRRIDSCKLDRWPKLPLDWPETASLVSTAKAKSHLEWMPRHSYSTLLAQFAKRQ